MEAQVQLRDCDVPLLKCCLERLLQLFECLTQVDDYQDHIQLRLWTHKTDETLRNAQDYLLSVTSENPAFEERIPLPSDRVDLIFSSKNDIEREARIILRFAESDLLIWGPKSNVENAMQIVESYLSHDVANALKHSYTADSLLSDPIGLPGRRDGRLPRRVESEDSSYDSDTESGLGAGTSAQAQPKAHNDVSRTVSDTLAAEFAEYVNTQKVELKTVLADPSYHTRLEFAIKLGYTEAQVQIALQRLGLTTSNNELAAELIKLSSTAKTDIPEVATASPVVSAELRPDLRPIVIDGSNVAMSHGNTEIFSCRGIKICVDWFRARGHKEITVFVPSWRKEAARPNTPISNQDILFQLEREKVLKFTPSRNVGGKRMVCYEDRYILKLAVENDGVVVSNDNYRDLVHESAEFKKVVDERLLMYTFVKDLFMPPDDPLGRNGPTLNNFLKHALAIVTTPLPPICPYAKKCTYGNKCKFYHPERGNMPQKAAADRLGDHAKLQMQDVRAKANGHELTRTRSVPVSADHSVASARKKQPLSRTRSAAPAQRPQDDTNQAVNSNGEVLWRHQSWSNLPKTMLSESGHLSLAKKLSDPDPRCSDRNVEIGGNLHRKLQRQLTLNPTNDERLSQMRLINSQGRTALNSQHGLSQNEISSDGWQNVAHLSGLNSTSDTKLNMFPNQFVPPTCYQANIWSPISTPPHAVRPSSVPPQNRMRAPLMGPPQHQGLFNSTNIHSTGLITDERQKLYYHLTSIFPEEHVKLAMDMLPDEKDSRKICAAILDLLHSSSRQ